MMIRKAKLIAKQDPLISVCITTYNSEKYIYKALYSVIHQTYSNLEIIIVDNYSTDKTLEIINSLKDPRVKVLKKRNFGSIAASRNHGIIHSTAEWIAFLDSDDYWEIDKIKKCSKYLRYDLIYHKMNIIKDHDDEPCGVINSKNLRKPVFKNLLIRGNTIATSSVLVRKDLLKKIGYMNENLLLAGTEDYNTWLKISRLTEKFKMINKKLGSYRIHSNNFSNQNRSQPPWDAIKEFQLVINPQISKLIELNYAYAVIRLKYLRDRKSVTNSELFKLLLNMKGPNKFKILFMILTKRKFLF
ncbi:MAG: hypothetical protein RI943_342 [Bacteroidota bacterium]|jgi:glycosyltransferase involved in cell wall biosynthesis